METRLITHIRRDIKDRTVAVCNPSEPWSPKGRKDVVLEIEGEPQANPPVLPSARYFVEANGARSEVVVVSIPEPGGGARKWLRTAPDESAGNNLASLPEYEDPDAVPPDPVVRVRRNVATVSKEERDRLRDAILGLDKIDALRTGISWWDMQHLIHERTHVHDGPAFLTYHRHLTNRFEALLQRVDPGVALHYWDWQTDPRRSPDGRGGFVNLFDEEFMGTASGQMGQPFKVLSSSPRAQIVRSLRAGTPRDFRGAIGSDLDAIQGDTFQEMRKNVEAVHNHVHDYFGDGSSIQDIHTSFHDPFVFLLHSNVDRLYASWQLARRGDSRRALDRLDPNKVYGDERDTEDGMVPTPGGHTWGAGLMSDLSPWDGEPDLEPWKSLPEPINSLDPSVVRPPLYDRYADHSGASWNAMLGGLLLPDGDLIEATITAGAAPSDQVRFELEAGPRVDWWKGLRVPDGEGSSWLIQTSGQQRHDSVSLWAHQVHNRQELIFHKAKERGAKRIVYRIGDLGRLLPGTRVKFKWWEDSVPLP